jgi:nitrate reductase gamma subunit
MIKAKAFKDGMIDSDTATATYVINIVTPSPNGGAFISSAVFYAVIIIVVAAIVAVVLLLLRRARPKSAFTQRTTKPKLTKG